MTAPADRELSGRPVPYLPAELPSNLKIVFNQTLTSLHSKLNTDTVLLQTISNSARGILCTPSDISTVKVDDTYKPFFLGKANRYFIEEPPLFVKYGDNLKEKPQFYDYF